MSGQNAAVAVSTRECLAPILHDPEQSPFGCAPTTESAFYALVRERAFPADSAPGGSLTGAMGMRS